LPLGAAPTALHTVAVAGTVSSDQQGFAVKLHDSCGLLD
jgi:hypothetical protein